MKESSLVIIKEDYSCIEIVRSEKIRKLCDGVFEAIYKYRNANYSNYRNDISFDEAFDCKETCLESLDKFIKSIGYSDISCAWCVAISGVLPKDTIEHTISHLRRFQKKTHKVFNY